MGDLIFAEQDHMISATAQMVSTYSQFDVKLPQSVLKLQSYVLRDFSLLHPIKTMEALDPDAFEKEEIEIKKQLLLEHKQKEKDAMKQFKTGLSVNMLKLK